jgi:hypothetical protein
MLYVLLFLLALVAVLVLPIAIFLFLYRWLKRKGFATLSWLVPVIVVGVLLYPVYIAFYPRKGFYIKEFETNSGIPFPPSAEFIRKDATYPDLHGSYTSRAVIKLSTQDYNQLYQKLKADSLFRKDTSASPFLGETVEFFGGLFNGVKDEDIEAVLVGYRKAQFKVGFLKDRRRIVFERHSS